jgi:hypothetical protein
MWFFERRGILMPSSAAGNIRVQRDESTFRGAAFTPSETIEAET